MVIKPASGLEAMVDVEWTTEAPELGGRNGQYQGVWWEEEKN